MKYTKSLAALLLAVTLSPNASRAQQPTTTASPAADTATDEANAEALELEGKALALLNEVVGEMPSLKLVENRIRLQAVAAELLWPRDQERAREIFNAAATDLAAVVAGIETDDPQYYNLVNMTSQLRQRMLTTIAQYDPKLALEFLRSTRMPPPPTQPGVNFRQPDQELMLEAQLAQQIAARDPQQALRLAEEILSRGLSSNLMPLLDQLRARDPEGATRLTAGVVKKLRSANFATDYEATSIASYLLLSTRAPENAGAQTTGGAPTIAANLPNPRRLQLDEQTRRELVGSLVNAAVAAPGNPGRGGGNVGGLLSAVRQLMPEVERYVPAQAAGVRRRLDGFDQRVERGNNRGELRQLMQTGTTDALMEAATKATPDMRQQLYRAAAWKAFNDGNPERARQIVNTNIEGTRQREQFLRELDNQLFWRAASEGNIESAQALLSRVKAVDERVGMLIQLARIVAAKGNQKGALSFLEEASTLVEERAKGHSQFSMQLQLAHVYAPLSPARAFELVEASITHLNELVAAAAVIDGFGQEAFAQDELKAQEGHLWGALATQCGETLAALAPADFEHARSAAERFQRPELRLQARLAVARGILVKEDGRNNVMRNPLRRGGREGIRPRFDED
ncbi:MAG TPA: hypothetical protein VGO96_15800 [Pyrinomonadaceae bacterium]|jgi:hypothetical protein|nr:hypothetical protein [Pyrinomonadaceae bacterium]